MESMSLGRYEIVIPGKPVALKRTRITNNRCYDSQKSEKLSIYLIVKEQWDKLKLPLYMDPVHIDVVFIFPIPSSYSAAKKRMLKTSPRGITSDVDNLLKALLDSIQGLCFSNDNLVASVQAKKIYGNTAKTIFSLRLL